MPTTYDAIEILLLFLVPGYIMNQVFDRSILRVPRGNTEAVLHYLCLSAINYMAVLALSSVSQRWQQPATVQLVISLFVLPFGLGVALTFIIKRSQEWRWVRSLQDRLDIFTIDPTPKAWDMVFHQRKSLWVIVTLTDGCKVGGWLGDKSFTSSYPAIEDLYIHEEYRITKNDGFLEIKPPRGIWIKADRIQHVRFFHDDEPAPVMKEDAK